VKALIRPAAREDILRQYRYYLVEKDAATAAERFLNAVQLATEELCRHPDMGAPLGMKWPHLAGLR
jgi:plasmid stabilization system protein ParE